MNSKSESSMKIPNVSVQQQLKNSLEKLALKNNSFQKAKHTLTNLSFKVIEIEERGRFLKRCVRTKLLPSKGCIRELKMNTKEGVNEQSLNKEDIENGRVLIAEQANYIKEIKCAVQEPEPCYQEILLRLTNIESQKMRKEVKHRYIELFSKLEKEANLDSNLNEGSYRTNEKMKIQTEENKRASTKCYTHQTFSRLTATNQRRNKIGSPINKYRGPSVKTNSNFKCKENTDPLKLGGNNAKKYDSDWKKQKLFRQYDNHGYKPQRSSIFSNNRVQPSTRPHMERSMVYPTPAQHANTTEKVLIQESTIMLDVLEVTGLQAKLKNVNIGGDS